MCFCPDSTVATTTFPLAALVPLEMIVGGSDQEGPAPQMGGTQKLASMESASYANVVSGPILESAAWFSHLPVLLRLSTVIEHSSTRVDMKVIHPTGSRQGTSSLLKPGTEPSSITNDLEGSSGVQLLHNRKVR